MSLYEDTNRHKLKEMLQQIHAREAALPDFQRDFVWDPNATKELIVSIASNYPAGSLLRIRNTHNLFACRALQGAPDLDGQNPTYLVLDGQQRLTSLYQAFYGVGEHRYYLNVRQLLQGAVLEECLFHLRANRKQALDLESFDKQARELILPLSVLTNDSGGYVDWSRKVRRTRTHEERDALEDALGAVEDRWIKTIDAYEFPVVTLSDRTSAEAVCTIFETLNRTGVKLSVFDLLTARFWPRGINLRELWAQARITYPIIADFAVNPYCLLQVVALASRGTPSCERSDVLNLETAAMEAWWGRAARGVAEALAFLRDDCGVITHDWLPNDTIVTPLAAVLARSAGLGSPQAGANRYRLVRWFWCSVYGQSYDKASNHQAAKDVSELLTWLDGGEAPESVRRFTFDPQLLRDITSRQRTLYRGTICLILSGQPRDFYNAAKLTGDLMIEHRVDDHHIFPRAYLERQKVNARLRDCILNRTLIDRSTNIRIGSRPPSAYMGDIQRELGGEQFAALLRSHLLPAEPESPLWRGDFDAFLDWRQERLWHEIKRATGLENEPVAKPPGPPMLSSIPARTPPTRRPAATATRNIPRPPIPKRTPSGEYGFMLHNEYYPARNAQGVLVQILQRLAAADATFIDRLARRAQTDRQVQFIARTQDGLNRERPDLARENSAEFAPGWWVYLKYSKRDIEEKIKMIADVAGLAYDTDLITDLNRG